MQVIKRDGTSVDFDAAKIVNAILKANAEVDPEDQVTEAQATEIANKIGNQKRSRLLVEQIQDNVENSILRLGKYTLGKTYTNYRYKRALVRKANTTDNGILTLLDETNQTLIDENSNKNAHIASTQRDLIAGEVSKDLTMRMLLPKKIVDAHNEGLIHFHDADYFIQRIHNCCLINISDMLDNGTMMNGKLIESPKGFQVACTVMTQIIAAVASNQYGGQSVAIKHLGKYLKRSEDKFRAEAEKLRQSAHAEGHDGLEDTALIDAMVQQRLRYELRSGVQTIQYQINTLMTTNGQSPFVTLFLELDHNDPYIKYTAMIIEEIFRQRIEGIKNASGVSITPAFPKLVYVLDDWNCLEGGEYDWLTKVAVECSAKRMYPDYVSAKIMKLQYEGNVFSPMGCRSFLSPWKDEAGNYKFEGRFNQGVVTINLPMVALDAQGDMTKFWDLLKERLELCFEALLCRHERLLGTKSDMSPIHWQYGALARLQPGETIDKLLFGGYSTISLGYIGVYEMTKVMLGVSHTDPKGKEFALKVMDYLAASCEKWKAATNIGFSVYSTPKCNMVTSVGASAEMHYEKVA